MKKVTLVILLISLFGVLNNSNISRAVTKQSATLFFSNKTNSNSTLSFFASANRLCISQTSNNFTPDFFASTSDDDNSDDFFTNNIYPTVISLNATFFKAFIPFGKARTRIYCVLKKFLLHSIFLI